MSVMSQVTTKSPALPSRVYLFAGEKWGKTSFACHAPAPVFVMTEGETGLLSLIDAGLVPETAHFPEDCKSWEHLNEVIAAVRDEPHDRKTLVIDTSNGAERLLSSWVQHNLFNGQLTGREGYSSYGKGDVACVPYWTQFLRTLDEIRTRRRMSIILLAHSRIKTVNNPEGPDYDQLRPEGIDKLWTLTHKWADVIAAGTWEVSVKDDKVTNGNRRVIRTAGSVAVVAGNRYGLPEKIAVGANAQQAFAAFAKELQKAKGGGKGQPAKAPDATPPATPPREPGTDDEPPAEADIRKWEEADEAAKLANAR